MKYLIFIMIVLFTCPAYAQGPNYCHDKESWKEWDELVAKYPHDMDIQMLHALKIGLCLKIEQNSISTQEAVGLFTNMLNTLIEQVDEAEKQEGKEEL
jgi:hypothetical protein